MDEITGDSLTEAIRETWLRTKDIGALRLLAPGYSADTLMRIARGECSITGSNDEGFGLAWVQ